MANWHLCGPEPGIFIYVCFRNQNKWVHREQNMMELHGDVITVILLLLFAWFFQSPQRNITSGVFPPRLGSPGWDAEGGGILNFSRLCAAALLKLGSRARERTEAGQTMGSSCGHSANRAGCSREHPSTFLRPYLVSGLEHKQKDSVNSQEKLLSDLTVWHERQWKDSLIKVQILFWRCVGHVD